MKKAKVYPLSLDNLKDCQDFILISLLADGKYKGSRVQRFIPEKLWIDIERESRFLGLISSNKAEQLLWIYKNYTEYPKRCLECSKEITDFESFNIGYLVDFCSTTCSNSNKNVQAEKIKSYQLRFGTNYGFQSDEVKEKNKLTYLKTFGVDHNMKSAIGFSNNKKAQFKLKDFVLPSGKILHLQGYEPLVLEHLLETRFTEHDFDFENTPAIRYSLGTYHPDFYIPSEKLIIEVKSTFTYEADLFKNLEKEKACLKQGYKFEFIIWNK